MQKHKPLYLTALGVNCALGNSKQEILPRLLAGDQTGLVFQQGWLEDSVACVGAITTDLPILPELFQQWQCRNNQLLLHAVQQIQPEIEARIDRYGTGRIGVVLGTSTSGIYDGERALEQFDETGQWPQGYHYRQQEMGCPASFLANYFALTGPAYIISTACSSSGKTFVSAQRLIHSGICDAVLVGGVDTLCRLTLQGFSALDLVSPQRCTPFTKERRGINIGEAAALFILESAPNNTDIKLLAVGESSDAYHISAPHPQGRGAIEAMEAALQIAGVAADDVDYINLHGTATLQNDAMESKAVAAVLGSKVFCSSTKGLTGHALGAAGAIEAAFCWLLLSALNTGRQLPPNITTGELDPALPPLRWVNPGDTMAPEKPRRIMMSNSFAFGGSNVCVVLGAHDV